MLKFAGLACAIAVSGIVSGCATAFDPVADPAALERGKTAYNVRCMGCHEPATPGAPTRADIAAMKPGRIYQSLKTGKMEIMAIDLPDEEAREIASYLAAKPS